MEALKKAVDELGKNMNGIMTDLEPRIKQLEATGKGNAELKETVDKMSQANAGLVDQIKAIQDAVKAAETENATFKEDLQKRLSERGAQSGRIKSAGMEVAAFMANNQKDMQQMKSVGSSKYIEVRSLGLDMKSRNIMPMIMAGNMKAEEVQALLKTITNDSASAGDAVDYMRIPGIFGPGQRQLLIRDLFPVGGTTSDQVRYVIEASVTDNAAPQAGQGVLKGESNFTFDATTVPIQTIAHFVVVSTQIIDDAVGLQSYVDGRMRYLLLLEEENQLLNGDGTGNNLNGVITQATAYDASLETSLGIASVQDIDRIRVAMYQVVASEYPPTGIVMNNFNWSAIELLKDGENRYLMSNPADATSPRLWGLPVATSLSMPIHEFLVGSFALGGQIWDRMQPAVAISTEDSTNFRQNLATLRVEERLALTIYRPLAFVTGDFSTATSGS